MTEVNIENGKLVARMDHVDTFLSVRRTLVFPIEHVTHAEVVPDVRTRSHVGYKMIGGYWPGWFRNGYFREEGKQVFWNVRSIGENKAISIDLHDEKTAKLILAVPDPEAITAMINEAVASHQ